MGEGFKGLSEVLRMERRIAAIKENYKDQYGVELSYDQALQAYKEETMPPSKDVVEGIPGSYFDPYSEDRILRRAQNGDTFSGTK